MYFKSISFKNFRNIKDSILPCSENHNIFVGLNGQGKTNLLEAIYILSFGSSFRTKSLKDCITHGKDFFTLKALFFDKNNEKKIIECSYINKKRIIKINNKIIIDRKELFYNIPCIVFSHSDMFIVNGEMEEKRRYFNQSISLYDSLYFDDIRRYNRLLKQRNTLIKENNTDLLSIYNDKLSTLGLYIMEKRENSIKESNKILSLLYKKISNTDDEVFIEYKPSWKTNKKEDIIKMLESKLDQDLILKTTTTGIHRDKFIIKANDKDFNSVASTGQLRLVSLILKLAQLHYYYKKTNLIPLLLIDDVLLELDHNKREAFLTSIDKINQVFYTFLPEEKYINIEKLDLTKVFNIKNGEFLDDNK